ncbi:type I methionyl aminopeptidase, partial [Patescibacteria group bacterium]|nr:type I methionyl aminopeptidase [Patescibacteria group bacterium]
PFSSALCTCINQEVVHAPATPGRKLKSGDILKIDMGMWLAGMCTDMAATIIVGEVDTETKKLIQVTKEALAIGIRKSVAGGWVSDVGRAIDKHVQRHGFSTVKDLVGHGVGREVHEDPRIPNYFDPSLSPVKFIPGMTFAIEPMINAGVDAVRLMSDGWTIITADGRRSAHFEETLAITEDGTLRVTPLPDNV